MPITFLCGPTSIRPWQSRPLVRQYSLMSDSGYFQNGFPGLIQPSFHPGIITNPTKASTYLLVIKTLRNPYVESWNLAIQQSLPWRLRSRCSVRRKSRPWTPSSITTSMPLPWWVSERRDSRNLTPSAGLRIRTSYSRDIPPATMLAGQVRPPFLKRSVDHDGLHVRKRNGVSNW